MFSVSVLSRSSSPSSRLSFVCVLILLADWLADYYVLNREAARDDDKLMKRKPFHTDSGAAARTFPVLKCEWGRRGRAVFSSNRTNQRNAKIRIQHFPCDFNWIGILWLTIITLGWPGGGVEGIKRSTSSGWEAIVLSPIAIKIWFAIVCKAV